MFFSVSKLLLLIIALSVDSLAAGFIYGADKVKIPPLCAVIISLLSDVLLIGSLFVGNICKAYIPQSLTAVLSFAILFLLGTIKLFDRSQTAGTTGIDSLSPKEAFSLGLALSLDSAAAGLGAACSEYSLLLTALLTFLISLGALSLGCRLGRRLAAVSDFNFSIIGGILLIILALSKLC